MLGLTQENLKLYKINKNIKDVALIIDRSNNIYNSVNYGVPQKRLRFICGEFPKPDAYFSDESKDRIN